MSDKLTIASEMLALDRKDRNFYKSLTDEEKKKFSNYLMIRYGASVQGDTDLQAYYLMATNERLNKYFFDLNKHPELQWLLVSTISPGLGKQHHQWIAGPKKKVDASGNKVRKFLLELYPSANNDELNILEATVTRDQLVQLAKDHGWTDKQIKQDLPTK